MSLFAHMDVPVRTPVRACPPRPASSSAHAPTNGAFGLRDYQRRAVDNIGACLRDNPSTLLVMPTGTGKTVVIAHAIRAHCAKRALVLAHRQELIAQNARTIESVLGEPCGIEMADRHSDLPGLHRPRVIVASKDSLHAKRIVRFNPSEFGLIVTDEAHHAVAGSYGRVYEHFSGVPHLGVTATPDRLDEAALGRVFASVAMTYEIADAINDGWLVPVRAHTVYVKDLQLAEVKTTGGDLNQGELAEQMEAERVLHEVAASVTREARGRRAIIFTVSVRQAARLAEILNDYEPDSARYVCGETPDDRRAFDLAEHRAGRYRYVCNVGVLTEGYDDPGCSMIVMARPTKSRALFAQCIGRGTRPLAGGVDGLPDSATRRAAIAASAKPHLTVLDFTGNCGRHRLVTPADVLGGDYEDADIDAASAAMQSGECDVADALARARRARMERESEPARRADELRAARARVVALARYALAEEDLFDGAAAMPGRERGWATGKAPTPAQVETLERAGFGRADVEQMSRAECSRLIGGIITRRMAGLCTLKQARMLERFGYRNARNCTFEHARAILDARLGGRR
jgi:superfamily II DNA or RNA helicase